MTCQGHRQITFVEVKHLTFRVWRRRRRRRKGGKGMRTGMPRPREKRTWWNMRIDLFNFTTSGLQTRHVQGLGGQGQHALRRKEYDETWELVTRLPLARGGRCYCSLFLTMRCFPILNNAIFRRCSEKNINHNIFDDVRKKLKHRAHDAY